MTNASTLDRFHLDLKVMPQPTETTCGPTCLQAVYGYYGDSVPIARLVKEVATLEDGGTLAVLLGIHALKRGYKVTLYTYNLRLFDPTWFNPLVPDFRKRIQAQIKISPSKKRQFAASSYLEFSDCGGEVRLEDLTSNLIRKHLKRGTPILTGLSATFLYRSRREIPETNREDDMYGRPVGHFVVLCGYDQEEHRVRVADPLDSNPLSPDHFYFVNMERLINAILLGILTYDANLLIIEPRKGK